MQENKAVVFIAYLPGLRARDYQGVRIYGEATEILTFGEKFELGVGMTDMTPVAVDEIALDCL